MNACTYIYIRTYAYSIDIIQNHDIPNHDILPDLLFRSVEAATQFEGCIDRRGFQWRESGRGSGARVRKMRAV